MLRRINVVNSLLLLFALGCSSESAAAHDDEYVQVTKDDCAFLFAVSESVMTNRQNGMSITDALELSIKNKDALLYRDAELYKQLVVSAYQKPVAHSESSKKSLVSNFSNKVRNECIWHQKK